jgi:hypothetical protein
VSGELIVMDHYVPRVGLGRDLREALQEKNRVWLANDLPGYSIWRPHEGPHNSLVTIQRWPTFADFARTQGTLPSIPECRSVVFDVLYPTNSEAYTTTFYEAIS